MGCFNKIKRLTLYIVVVFLFTLIILPYLVPLPNKNYVSAASLAGEFGQFVDANGQQAYVERVGDTNAPAVVFLHGFGASTVTWAANLQAVADAGYQAIALDINGFGLSEKQYEDDFTHVAQAHYVAAVLDALAIEQATIVGHSMGGSISAHFEILYPDRVLGLVFVDGGAFQLEGQGRSSGLANLTLFPPFRRWASHVLLRRATPERVMQSMERSYADPAFLTPELARATLNAMQTEDWDLAMFGILRDSSSNGVVRFANAEQLPILLIWGAQDRRISLRTGQRYAGRLNGAELVVIDDAGHVPMVESAESFNAALIEFLTTRIDPSP